jgi:hypothetical protein
MKGKKRVKSYIQALATSDTKKEAKLTAGYAPSTSTSQIESSITFKIFQKALAEQIKDDDTIKVYKDALKANKKDKADHYIRLGAAKEVNKLKGQYKQLEGSPMNPIDGVEFGW